MPVLTIPTDGHGEQLLNAAVHARNFPNLVRQRPKLDSKDIRWLVNFDLQDPMASRESRQLRTLVTKFLTEGSPMLGGGGGGDSDRSSTTAAALKRRVTKLVDAARVWVNGDSSPRST